MSKDTKRVFMRLFWPLLLLTGGVFVALFLGAGAANAVDYSVDGNGGPVVNAGHGAGDQISPLSMDRDTTVKARRIGPVATGTTCRGHSADGFTCDKVARDNPDKHVTVKTTGSPVFQGSLATSPFIGPIAKNFGFVPNDVDKPNTTTTKEARVFWTDGMVWGGNANPGGANVLEQAVGAGINHYELGCIGPCHPKTKALNFYSGKTDADYTYRYTAPDGTKIFTPTVEPTSPLDVPIKDIEYKLQDAGINVTFPSVKPLADAVVNTAVDTFVPEPIKPVVQQLTGATPTATTQTQWTPPQQQSWTAPQGQDPGAQIVQAATQFVQSVVPQQAPTPNTPNAPPAGGDPVGQLINTGMQILGGALGGR